MSESKWGEASLGYDPQLLGRFQARESDVFVNTAPKAGTTWMSQILHHLRDQPAEFESIYDVVPWIEFPGRLGVSTDERLAKYEAIADPRIFKAHLPHERTPGASRAKFVIVARDPRDRCVSAYHHMNDMTDEFSAWLGVTRPASFDAFFDEWVARPHDHHVASWWEHRSETNVHWVRFERLKSDFDETVRDVAGFLGWELTESKLAVVRKRASFAWMSEHWDKFTRFSADEVPSWKPKTFVRRGAVGDHKATLSAEQEAQVLANSRAALSDSCLEFLGLAEQE